LAGKGFLTLERLILDPSSSSGNRRSYDKKRDKPIHQR
jgi:hypothetical protein